MLYGKIRWRGYIELHRQDRGSDDGFVVGILGTAMYGTRDAPQIWQEEVRKAMKHLGFESRVLHSSLFYHRVRNVTVVFHVDDFLRSGTMEDLLRLYCYRSMEETYDLKHAIPNRDSGNEVKCFDRIVRWTPRGIELEGDEQHAKILRKAWSTEECSEVETAKTKDGQDRLNNGEELHEEEEARRARRAIARISYMAQDRLDISVVARVLSLSTARRQKEVLLVIKRVIRYLRRYPRCTIKIGCDQNLAKLDARTDSDWAVDVATKRFELGTATVHHWSKPQANVALSSGEAELDTLP